MSGGSTITKDFMKIESDIFNSDAITNSTVENNNNGDHDSIACIEKGSMNEEHKRTGLKLTKDMAQTICLFRKYLLTKTQQNMGKTNMEESEAIKSCPPRSLISPKFGSNRLRHPSFLEQKLLPGIRGDAIQSSSSQDKSSTAQLTIFYSGTITVYDNVPADKAQAIMLLAGESSSSNLANKKVPKPDATIPPIHRSNLPSVCKLQAELPVARKYSIQRFLEKRRDRITNKAPYVPSHTKNEDNERSEDNASNGNHSFSPFPSRLGYFFPISTNNRG